MAVELFGFSIGRVDKDQKNKKSFALPEPEDGALEVGPTGNAYGTYVDLEGYAKNELELIKKYREMATYPECDQAIDDVVNEAIVTNREESPVSISLEKSNLSDTIKLLEPIKNKIKAYHWYRIMKKYNYINTFIDTDTILTILKSKNNT